MANKTWLEIAKQLDECSLPKADSWHMERESKRQIDRMLLGQSAPTSGYAVGNLAMSLANSLANGIYRQLNMYLMAPFSTDVALIAQRYQQWMTAAPAGPDIMDFSLSGIPMSQVTMSVSDKDGDTGVSGTPVGVQTTLSADYNCFMNGYQKLWKYQMFAARFWRMYEKYLTTKDVGTDPVLNASKLSDIAATMSDMFLKLETLFRECLCDSFKDCGIVAPETAPDDGTQYKCALTWSSNIVAQKQALSKRNTDEPEDILVLLSKCKSGGDLLKGIIETLNGSGVSGQEKLGYFFRNVQIIYNQTVRNTNDWAQSLKGDTEESQAMWRQNSMLAFRLFIYSFCQISQSLREMYAAYANMAKSVPYKVDSNSQDCTAQRAAYVYSQWLARVFYHEASGTWDYAVPSYIKTASSYLLNCSKNIQSCADADGEVVNEVWKHFDFADISLPRSLPPNSVR
jgi:hypothetical protein